jgi:cupin 2 domain-containing protein
MTDPISNFFHLTPPLPDREQFDAIVSTENVLIERIISTGQTTPPGEWYDQERDEWVVLLQGNAQLSYPDGSAIALKPGDYLLLPAHQKHRVEYTSLEPPCIWLAVHFLVDS